jgi:hypothetical protein
MHAQCLSHATDEVHLLETGRGERIRTSGLYVPNVALYQAKLHPEVEPTIIAEFRMSA